MRLQAVLVAAAFVTAALDPSPARAAGNVAVSLDQGELSLQGDSAPNTVVLTGGAEADSIAITGDDGTLVDGGTDLTIAGVQQLRLDMGDGPDRVELRQLTLDGRAIIRLDDGDDVLAVEQARFGDRLRIFGGRGRDAVSVGPVVRVARQLRIQTGRDRDFVTVRDSTLAGIVLVTGKGDDAIGLFGLAVGGPVTLFAGAGEDDVTAASTRFEQDVDLNLGPDDDVLTMADIEFDDDAHLAGGDDDDLIDLGGFIDADDDVDIDGFEAGFF